MDTNNQIKEYLKNVALTDNLLELAKIDPEGILEEYILDYLDFKKTQETKSLSQAIPVQKTKISNIVNYLHLEDFDQWITTPEYKIYLANIISKLRTIGYILGEKWIDLLGSTATSKQNIYSFNFFTKFSVHPNFLTFQRILYTFGFGYQIFSNEFKKFFTCGHKLIGLIGSDNRITLTLNVDTLDEFFKRLSKLEEACVIMGIKHLFDEFKILFGKFKNYVIGLIIKFALNNWHVCGYKINLCLQECDKDLYLYLKDLLKDIFTGSNFSPQRYKIFQIDNFIDFAFNPMIEKIKQINQTNLIHGFATFTNVLNTITPIQVFNSLVLSHEKKSIQRGLVYTSRGIYYPELNLYNLHLKSTCAYENLVSLEKLYFENDLTQFNSIYMMEYTFTSTSYTQMFGVVALANKYPYLTTQQIHNIIDIRYERKLPFDQILTRSDLTNLQIVDIFKNIKLDLKEKYSSLFENVEWIKFIKAVNIHWIKSFEKMICKELLTQATKDLVLVDQVNPDLIIKEFCSSEMNKQKINFTPTLSNLVICGDINMILINLIETRIKKYSYKSKSYEDEPFNHFIQMQMNSSGNDVIFSL